MRFIGLTMFLRGRLSNQQRLIFEPVEGTTMSVDVAPLAGGGTVSLTLS